jgi:hypothetical protein
MDHPPYSPDLAPANFWLIPKVKSALKGKHFSDFEDIKSLVKKGYIPVQDFKNCCKQWSMRWEQCKELKGDYFGKF